VLDKAWASSRLTISLTDGERCRGAARARALARVGFAVQVVEGLAVVLLGLGEGAFAWRLRPCLGQPNDG